MNEIELDPHERVLDIQAYTRTHAEAMTFSAQQLFQVKARHHGMTALWFPTGRSTKSFMAQYHLSKSEPAFRSTGSSLCLPNFLRRSQFTSSDVPNHIYSKTLKTPPSLQHTAGIRQLGLHPSNIAVLCVDFLKFENVRCWLSMFSVTKYPTKAIEKWFILSLLIVQGCSPSW